MLKTLAYPTLTPEVKQEFDQYIQEEFGHVPFVQQHHWATPDRTVIRYVDGKVATFYNIVLRTVTADGVSLKVAGINNVITPKAFRGKGYASRTLQETKSFLFEDLQADAGLLLCADTLLPFYSRLSWYPVTCRLYFDQPQGKQLYDSNTLLLAPEGNEKLLLRKLT